MPNARNCRLLDVSLYVIKVGRASTPNLPDVTITGRP